MTTQTKKDHTPLPWKVYKGSGKKYHDTIESMIGKCEHIGEVFDNNAEFIVKAVNNHYELVEALRGLIVHLEWREDSIVEDAEDGNINWYSKAKQALSKVGE